jgi:hypothetical protein
MATATSDNLEPLGVGFGALLVLVGLATLVGTPWAYKSGGLLLTLGQALGAVAAVGIGAGLAWLARK